MRIVTHTTHIVIARRSGGRGDRSAERWVMAPKHRFRAGRREAIRADPCFVRCYNCLLNRRRR